MARPSREECWERFLRELEACEGWMDTVALTKRGAPAQSHPCRPLYSNLGFFVHQGGIPDGADARELRAYAAFLDRCEPPPPLKQGERDRLREALLGAASKRA